MCLTTPIPSALCLGEEPVVLKLGEAKRTPWPPEKGRRGFEVRISSCRSWAQTHLFPVHGLGTGTCRPPPPPRSVLLASGAGMANCVFVLGAQTWVDLTLNAECSWAEAFSTWTCTPGTLQSCLTFYVCFGCMFCRDVTLGSRFAHL